MSGVIDWTFGGTWPYQPRWFESTDGMIHYVDEGPRDGRPVVLLHGNPTWGYLYRRCVPPLTAASARTIVPDHLGFGRSAMPGELSAYTIARHADRLEALLDEFDLREAVIVAHDWGGPIGLRWATRHPSRVAGLCIINTLTHDLWAGTSGRREPLALPAPLRLFRAPVVGPLLVRGLDAFKPAMFMRGIEHRARLTHDARHAYRSVHAGWTQRAGMLAFVRQLPVRGGGSVNGANRQIESGLREHFRSKPVHIVWGLKDRVLRPSHLEDCWLETFPQAKVTAIPDAGHFVQEDAPERLNAALMQLLGEA